MKNTCIPHLMGIFLIFFAAIMCIIAISNSAALPLINPLLMAGGSLLAIGTAENVGKSKYNTGDSQ